MKLVVDAEKCQGHARCVMILPEVFDTDDLGYAFLCDELRPGMEDKARQAIANCPEQAIHIADDETVQEEMK